EAGEVEEEVEPEARRSPADEVAREAEPAQRQAATPRWESRATVGLRAPTSRPRFPGPLRGMTAHWHGPAMKLAGRPHAECRAGCGGIQTFHMDSDGWADVAYSFAVCHHAVAMEGRGTGVRTAANGTNAGNDTWLACIFLVGGNEHPSTEMLV